MLGVSSNYSPFDCLRHGLSLGPGLTAGWPVILTIHLSPPLSQTWGFWGHTATPSFLYRNTGDQNSDCHAYVTCTLPIGPPHQPLSSYFFPLFGDRKNDFWNEHYLGLQKMNQNARASSAAFLILKCYFPLKVWPMVLSLNRLWYQPVSYTQEHVLSHWSMPGPVVP